MSIEKRMKINYLTKWTIGQKVYSDQKP